MPFYKFAFPNTHIEWLKQLGASALYALLLFAGELLFDSDDVVGHFEPASGLALAILLLGGKRYAWGIFLGATLVHVALGDFPAEIISVASCDTLQALCGAWLITRDGRLGLRLLSLYDYFRLILLGGVFSVAVGALAVSLLLLASGVLTADGYFQSLLKWWMSDTLGVILITPLVLVWRQPEGSWHKAKQVIEACLLLGLTMLVGQIIFLGWLRGSIGYAPQSYWMFLLITWIAMTLGARGTTLALLVVAVQALSGAMRSTGFFSDDIAASHLMNFWFYMLILSMVGMSLATYFHEIRQANFAISHRDALIREIHHRIKNNLQGVTGLLRQLANSHPETAEPINQTIGQVQSIAVIHGLQEREPTSAVRLSDLIKAVATGVGSLWQKTIAVEVPSSNEPYIIGETEAVPIALILNELLSNSIKHGGQIGQTRIVLTHGQHPGSVQIAIHNTGQLPLGFNFDNNANTGLQLVKSLMPTSGAELSFHCHDHLVIATLKLEPPVISLEAEP